MRFRTPLAMSETVRIPGILAETETPTAPHATALECGSERLDYGDLAERVRMLASRLAHGGVRRGSRVALAARRDADSYAAMLALLALGAAYVPLDLAYPPARLRAMLSYSGAEFVTGTQPALAGLPQHAIPELILDSGEGQGFSPTLGDLDPALLAYVLFTSGSTGIPKGVAMPRAPLARLIGWHQREPRLCRPARTLAFAPMSFDVHFQELHATLATGGCLVLVDEVVRRDPRRLLDALERLRIERLFVPYVALQMLADAAQRSARVPHALADVISAGETLRITPAIRALFRRLPDARLHNHYGPTESHVVSALQLGPDPNAWPELPAIGSPLPHVRFSLRRPPYGAELPRGQGELLIGGDCLANGYVGQADLSTRRFLDNPDDLEGRWYASGDLACRDAGGNWHCLGRIDAQIKIDGYRVEPAEVEVALLGLSGVQAAAVDVRELPGLGKQLVAWIVPAPDDRDALSRAARLRDGLREILPSHLLPTRILDIEALPETPSGKIDRKALTIPGLAGARPSLATDPLARVRDAWATLLGLEDVDPDANVFDLGARSLSVVRLLAMLEASGTGRLEVADIYAAPTPRGQAARLSGHDHDRVSLDAANRRAARQRAAFARTRPEVGGRHG